MGLTRKPCPEVLVLRTFTCPTVRGSMRRKLIRKYGNGRRCAQDICDALGALRAQMRYLECNRFLLACITVVDPIPTLLLRWACTHADILQEDTLRSLLRLAPLCPRYRKHIRLLAHNFTATPAGLAALAKEGAALWCPVPAHQMDNA